MARAFISYAREDNATGVVTRIVRALENELSLLSGETETFWFDTRELEWGAEFDDRIKEALLSSTFFIPFLTTRYFNRPYCRMEATTFTAEADRLGRRELVKPIYLASVQAGIASEPTDPLAVRLLNFPNRSDWRRLRLAKPHSGRYQREIHNMATALLTARDASERLAPDLLSPGRRKAITEDSLSAGEQRRLDESSSLGGIEPGIAHALTIAESAWYDVVEPLEEIARIQRGHSAAMAEATSTIRAGIANRRPASAVFLANRHLADAARPLAEDLDRAADVLLRAAMHAEAKVGDFFLLLSVDDLGFPVVRKFVGAVATSEESTVRARESAQAMSDAASFEQPAIMRPIQQIMAAAELRIDDAQKIMQTLGERANLLLSDVDENHS